MALKVELKPNERILIGESVITNCKQRSWLVIEERRYPSQAHLPGRAADVHVTGSAPAP
jgi:hypothetical protein